MSNPNGYEANADREWKVIGTRPIRHDGIDKVTGRALYGADIQLPGLLHGKVLRSPHAHARIVRIDVSRAAAHPGVHAVITGADLPDVQHGQRQSGESTSDDRDVSDNVLAKDRVLYTGHAIAAVAATNAHVAEEALGLIDVEYEVLPHVLDAKEAMEPGAPILHEGLRTSGVDEDSGPTNVAAVHLFEQGNLESGFDSADLIVEREFQTAMVHQGYIEPHNAVAQTTEDGQATLWCSTQGPFEIRKFCADILKRPLSSIRVFPAEIGGGFGGKTTVYLEPLAILLAERSGRPVKMVMTRTEVLQATGPTSGSHLRVRMGATRDGRIVAADVWMAYEAGAYKGSPVQMGCICALAPYDIENLRVKGLDVVVNRPKTAAYRAPGASNAGFAVETVVDELAQKLEMDPISFRIDNAGREGTRTAPGPKMPKVGIVEMLEAARDCEHYKTPLGEPSSKEKKRGRGFAVGYWFNAGLQSSATIGLNQDGTANVVTGSPDIGGTRTSCAMIAAEELGIDVDKVRPNVADTDSVGHTDVTGGSRVTMATGLAVYQAAQDVKRQLRERAAKTWDAPVDEIEFADGEARWNGKETVSLVDLAKRAGRTGGPIVGRATVNAQRATAPSYAGLLVDVEVDVETGKVDVTRCTVLQDAGKAIHPAYVEGQMQGGTAQGIGWALNEEYFYDESGTLRNSGFLDYRMPVALDLPLIEPIIIETPNPRHPLGIRGVGEASIVPPPGAVGNAIGNAVGKRMTVLPMAPHRVLAAASD